jgi:hypothetical protein
MPGCHKQVTTATIIAISAERFGYQLPSEEILEIFATDLDLDAQGLDVWLGARSAPGNASKEAASRGRQ